MSYIKSCSRFYSSLFFPLFQDPTYSTGRFGEIRELIVGMLDTYNYESVSRRYTAYMHFLKTECHQYWVLYWIMRLKWNFIFMCLYLYLCCQAQKSHMNLSPPPPPLNTVCNTSTEKSLYQWKEVKFWFFSSKNKVYWECCLCKILFLCHLKDPIHFFVCVWYICRIFIHFLYILCKFHQFGELWLGLGGCRRTK